MALRLRAERLVSLPSVRRWYFPVLAALVTYFALVPGQRAVAAVLVGAFTAAALVYGASVQHSARRGAWLTLALAVLVLSVGFAADIASRTRGGPEVHSLLANVFYLLTYLPLAVGLLWLGRPRIPSRDLPTILDTIAISLAVGLVAWIEVVRPQIMSLQLTGAGKVTAVVTWVGFMVVLATALRVVLAWRMNLALAGVTLGVLAFLVSAYLYGLSRIDGTRPDIPLVGAGVLVFCGLFGAAGLVPSMTKVASAPFAHYEIGPWRLGLLALALLVAPTALLVEAAAGDVNTALAIAMLSSAVGGLVLIHLGLAIRAYRSRAALEQVGLDATRKFVAATTSDEVEAAIAVAFRSMLPSRARSHTVLEERGWPDAAGALTPTPSAESPAPRADGMSDLRVPLDHEQEARSAALRSVVFTGPPAKVTELSAALRILAGQAASALARIDLMARLRVDERERYFRTLVLTSSDVILICRKGRIEYVTPSAYAMFGHDVTGEMFDTVVERHVPGAEGSGPDRRSWPDTEVGADGSVRGPDGADITVHVRRRDLSDDPTVSGVVTTLRDVTREQEFQRGLAHRATHDALTGLANAGLFREQLRLSRDDVKRGLSAALFIDLDDFKMINDRYGHEVGDGVLVTVARRLQSCLSEGDLAARLGGDEFAVLLRHVPNETAAQAIATRIADALARRATIAGVNIDGRASIGLALAHTRAETDALLGRADAALYTAKADGKGRWREYRDGMATPGRKTTDLRHELEAAIRDQSLTVHYEPIVDFETGQAEGFEALVHFDQLPGQSMQPERLAAITEDDALLVSLGDWVLRRALADLAIIDPDDSGHRPFVSVNVSPRQLQQPGFIDTLHGHLAATNMDASSLVIEITDSVLLADDKAAWDLLEQLRRNGMRIAIDDYGMGYASLSSLRHESIDIVKIDRSFVRDLRSQRARVLLEAVVRLASTLGLNPIAEGVDDAYTRDALLSLGCHCGQGRLYAPAMSASEAVQWPPPPPIVV